MRRTLLTLTFICLLGTQVASQALANDVIPVTLPDGTLTTGTTQGDRGPWTPDPIQVTLPDGSSTSVTTPSASWKEYEDWYHRHTTGMEPGEWPEDHRNDSSSWSDDDNYTPPPKKGKGSKKPTQKPSKKPAKKKPAPEPVATYWNCLAQDHQYSYAAGALDKASAQAEALRTCHAQSDAPQACYSHRCESY
jgi:hypothetical protein